ncbi:MAG: hypothetical protein KGL95_14525 [Patescibacteria group bacterium]|nr:hypothetical protein [Patescibacteria group bacterium]
MSVEDIINFVVSRIKQDAPSISRRTGITWSEMTTEMVSNIVASTLRAERSSIESFAKTEGIREDDLGRATEELLQEMFLQASRSGRKEVLPEDFNSALTSLQWHIWPFCKSGERSGGIGIRGP